MSLRTKLLLLSLLTLILPWAGWQYAQQMETTLRRAQEDALLTTAQVLSRVVASEPELLYRVPDLRREFDPARGDLFAPLLVTRPLLDGFASSIRKSADILADGTQDPNRTCDAISIGLGFEAVAAKVGAVAAAEPAPADPCSED